MNDERILCVEDDAQIRRLVERLVVDAGHLCTTVGSAEEARELIAVGDIAVVLCDIGLPGTSGLDLLEELARDHPDVATVMVTGRDDPEVADRALGLGAYGYITKPFAPNELLIDLNNALHRRKLEADRRTYEQRLENTVRERTDELRRAYQETVARLGRAIEFHDSETGGHVERVGTYAATIALALGFDDMHAERLRLAAPLHDVGKIAVSDAILRKTGPLDADEWREMERHTEIGHELLAGSGNELLDLAATIAWTHHERWDGSGYPRGLAGEQVPLEGRIVAVADAFDAITSDRPYRKAMSLAEARAILKVGRGQVYDAAVVDALLGSSR